MRLLFFSKNPSLSHFIIFARFLPVFKKVDFITLIRGRLRNKSQRLRLTLLSLKLKTKNHMRNFMILSEISEKL